mgnify:CR=1 FL=1
MKHDTVRLSSGTCRFVAHRGLSGLETENTCAAFLAAGLRGYWGIETDVHPTPDGRFVCSHDRDLRRISGVAGFDVRTRPSGHVSGHILAIDIKQMFDLKKL